MLAVLFAVSFVAFGVGGEVQGGLADLFNRGATDDGQPSASDARERLEENPRDPEALRDLATALQNEGRVDEAITPLETYSQVRPNDVDALRELASGYVAQGARYREQARDAQVRLQLENPGSQFLPPPTSELGQALADRPVTDATTARITEDLNTAYAAMQDSYTKAKGVYQRIAEREPEDPNVQIQLADASLNAGDTETALAAYRRFLELAPDDPSAPLVEQEIKRLEESLTPPTEEETAEAE